MFVSVVLLPASRDFCMKMPVVSSTQSYPCVLDDVPLTFTATPGKSVVPLSETIVTCENWPPTEKEFAFQNAVLFAAELFP